MIYNDATMVFSDDNAKELLEFLVKNNFTVAATNIDEIADKWNNYLFEKTFSKDLENVKKLFSPFIDDIKKSIFEEINNRRPDFGTKSNDGEQSRWYCIYKTLPKKVEAYLSHRDFIDETLEAYLNLSISIPNGKIKIRRTPDLSWGTYDWEFEVCIGDSGDGKNEYYKKVEDFIRDKL